METKIARGISYAFHPLLIPVYALVLLLNLDIFVSHPVPLMFKIMLSGIVLLTTFVIPVALTWLLWRLQLITSFFLTSKAERVYPILSVAVFYYVTFYILKGVHISTIFSFYMLGATLLAILSLVINFYHKISLHMTGIGSMTGLFLGLSLNFGIDLTTELITSICVAGIIGFARLKSNSHDPAEIYSGFVMGVFTMTLLMLQL
ncbi:MAG: hypothetical protein WCO44_14420 [Bacteroidota bacterium]